MKQRFAANYVFPIVGEPIKNGFVEVDDNGTITKIGELNSEIEDTQFFNGIICPSFTNAHCHIELSHLKGAFTEGSGMSGFINQINALRLSVEKNERIEKISAEMDQLYKQGVSGLADISNCSESFEIKAKSKIFSHTYLEQFGCIPNEATQIMKDARLLEELASKYKINASITPHSCYTMSVELLEKTILAGIEKGFLSYHNQESSQEEDLIRLGTGELAHNYKSRGLPTPPVTGTSALIYFIERLKSALGDRLEELSSKAKIMLVHNVASDSISIDKAEETLKELYWTICPLSNLFIHRQLPPLDLMISKNLKICIGTDSLSSNHILSIVEEIKCIQDNFPHIKLNDILRWACLNGAKAIGADSFMGSIELGKRPGLVLIENIDWTNFKLRKNSISTRLL